MIWNWNLNILIIVAIFIGMFFPLSSSYWKKKHHCWEWEDLHIFATKKPPGTRASPVARRRRSQRLNLGVQREMSFCCSKNLASLEGCFEKKKTWFNMFKYFDLNVFLSLHLRKSTLCFFRNRHADKGYKMSAAVPFLPMSPALEGIPGNQICWHCWSRAISMTRLHLGKIWQSTFFVSHLATCNDCPKAVCMGIIGNQSSFRGNPVWWIIDIFCGSHIFDTHIDRHTDRQIDRWVDR